MSSTPRTYRLNFVGDVMLGRLIDQLFPTHVYEPSEAAHVASFVKSRPWLQSYGPKSPWGSTLPLFAAGDLNLINLETSATTHCTKWPNKAFNYRMHPANIVSLREVQIDYASLANNHTLDFCEDGLVETVRTLKVAGIAFAGAGETPDEARRPAVLHLPRDAPSPPEQNPSPPHEIHIYSASDHPHDWAAVDRFHHLEYTAGTRARLKALLSPSPDRPHRPALKVFSVHWGPNYAWQPGAAQQQLAHFLVDECSVDIVHGHSAHHVQGVEAYNGALIIYGCGDYVDDYAIDSQFRNDLGAVWSVVVRESPRSGLALEKLEVFPTAIRSFQAQRLATEERDHGWVVEKVRELSKALGTRMESELGEEAQLVLNL